MYNTDIINLISEACRFIDKYTNAFIDKYTNAFNFIAHYISQTSIVLV